MTPAAKADILYRKIGNIELMGSLYRPTRKGTVKFVIDAHGGAWAKGDRYNNQTIHEFFAKNGIGVFALDFRLSGQAKFPDPVIDINFGVRWFKKHAASLEVETTLIGGLGSSSGAQQMGLIALQPNAATYVVEEPSLKGVDASLDFFIACWPILDPMARFQMAKETGKQHLVEAHNTYFREKSDMIIGNPYLVLRRGGASHKPPIVIVQGDNDQNVDHFRADMFADSYKRVGGKATVHKYRGQPHTFVTNHPEDPASQDAVRTLKDFIFSSIELSKKVQHP